MNIDLLRRLCETPGIPGREDRVRKLIEKEIKGLFDEVTVDAMGSLIATRRPTASRKGRATKVLLAAHMDRDRGAPTHIDAMPPGACQERCVS